MTKKFLRVFFTIALCALAFCGTAWAEGAEDTSAVQANDHILLGNYDGGPVDWIILDNEQMNDGNPGFFLFAKYVVQEAGVMYSYEYADWPGSEAQACCTDFYNEAFTDLERTVIPAVNVTEERSELYDLYWRPADLVNECVFYISAPELAKYYGPYDGADGLTATAPDGHIVYYWLRSPHGYHSDYSGIVYENGSVHDHLVYISWGGRPATNLQLDHVLYVTREGSEEDGTTLWKAAVIDTEKNFEVTGSSLDGNSLHVSYRSDAYGSGWQLALVIYDADGRVTGNRILGSLGSAEGSADVNTAELNIPSGGSIAFYALSSGEDGSIDVVSVPAAVRCAITFSAGEGSGSMEAAYAVPGTAVELPECAFTAPEHRKFDHWECGGERVENGTVISNDMALTAVYSDITVESIDLWPENLTLALGETAELSAQEAPLDAADPKLVWQAEKAGIVKLVPNADGSGCAVKAERVGTVTLICASEDGAASAKMTVTVEGSLLRSIFGNIEGIGIGLLLTAVLAAILLLSRKKQRRHRKTSLLKLLPALIPLLLCVIAFAVIHAGGSAEAEKTAVEIEVTPEPTPSPTPFAEPQLEAGPTVFINGGNPSQGSFRKDDILYVKLSDLAQLLETEADCDAETGRFTMPWRLSEAVITAESGTVSYLGENTELAAPALLCDGGSDVYVPLESLCGALQIGMLNDEENGVLYCTPGAGSWELPQGCVVPVFMYHGTGPAEEGANLIVSESALEEQINYLLDNGYTPIWFEDLWNVENIENPVILTFDDGWRDNYTYLYPLAEKYQIKVTIFAVTSFLDRSGSHLTTEQLVEMSQSPYVMIESHTVNHEDLDSMTEEDQAYEMEESRLQITRLTGKEPCALSYPEGGATALTQNLAMQYYRFATRMYSPTAYTTSDDPSWIYRLYVGRETMMLEFEGELTNSIQLANQALAAAQESGE